MIRSVDGKEPRIHPSVFVSEAAYIVGDVEIGEGSSVWPGAVIRGDYGKIIIGKKLLHPGQLRPPHRRLPGIGRQRADDPRRGHPRWPGGQQRVGGGQRRAVRRRPRGQLLPHRGLRRGAGRARVPDHSLLIGVPAQVKPLTPEQAKRLENPTASYVRNAKRYIDAGLGQKIPSSPD